MSVDVYDVDILNKFGPDFRDFAANKFVNCSASVLNEPQG